MTDEQFDTFVRTCDEEPQAKQATLEEQFGLGRHARWAYDGNSGILSFADERGVTIVEADRVVLSRFL